MRGDENELNLPASVYATASAHARAVRPAKLQLDHQRIADRLAEEDARREDDPRPREYREYSDWKETAEAFEAVMRERGIPFTPIRW
jgi:hypothetical protein